LNISAEKKAKNKKKKKKSRKKFFFAVMVTTNSNLFIHMNHTTIARHKPSNDNNNHANARKCKHRGISSIVSHIHI